MLWTLLNYGPSGLGVIILIYTARIIDKPTQQLYAFMALAVSILLIIVYFDHARVDKICIMAANSDIEKSKTELAKSQDRIGYIRSDNILNKTADVKQDLEAIGDQLQKVRDLIDAALARRAACMDSV